jgi:hypothetical protein
MRLIQFIDLQNARRVGVVLSAEAVLPLEGTHTLYALARQAIHDEMTLDTMIDAMPIGPAIDYERLIREQRLLPPVDHPDPAHMLVTGTGLTHLGSADARDRMHQAETENVTDSMRMFQLGLEGGKPEPGATGVQPEWFYKGDGAIVVPPYQTLCSPSFALDGGEEPEITGLYLIGPSGNPYRLGFALGNEFSDHVMERQNYLYLAHSKLRACAFGPELRLGELPESIEGEVRILRDQAILWEKPFLSGEAYMSHTLANLEYHHFKYTQFRRPGDVHAHFFGTATLSFSDGIVLEPGDEIEIEAEPFGRPLRNSVCVRDEEPVEIIPL